jgi:outer membrane receptor protein involved in Fe transport
MKKSRLMIAGSAISLALFSAMPSFAQEKQDDTTAATEDDEADADTEEEKSGPILVTGSRIARPTLESAVPLTSVTIEDLTGTGEVSLGDALNDLPSLRSTFSSGSTSRNIFSTSGLSLLDLRGLGTDRTLVLINGRRHVTSSPGDNAFDVNTIPIDLVDRIDIVTGGNSAVYGSDAVAGVVNFIMKRDYDGIKLSGQAGISSRGDRGTAFLSGVYGKNFADGRGNISIAAEFTRQNPLLAIQRDSLTGAFNGRCQFQTTEPTGGEPAAGDGVVDTSFLCGIKNASISDAGTIGALDPASNPTRRYLRFNNDGSLGIDTPTRSFAPFGSGNQQGGTGSTLFNTGGLLAAVDRYAFNVLGHFDVSDAFKPFIEAKYVRTDSSGEGQPSFFQGSIPGFFGGGTDLRCNNPFLQAQALTTLQSNGRCANVATGTFTMSRFNVDFGGRRGETKRETYRIVGGVEGTFNDDWRYEFAINYGKFQADSRSRNNLYLFDINGNDAGFLTGLDAVLAPVGFSGSNFVLNSTGQKVICRVNSVTNTDPACLPVNVFGSGLNSQAVLDSIHRDGRIQEESSQFVASAFVNGDLSQLFELPGGPISFAIGSEYREEKDSVIIDELSKSGGTFLNQLSDFAPPKLKVKEAYGEIYFPLLKDMSFAKELSVNLAGRVSNYNNSVGTVYAYNIQGIYSPVSDLKFRASYATSVRAPTQGDLYSAQSQNFAFLADPCDQNNINAGPNRVANCAAAGVPTTYNAATAAACSGTAFNFAVGSPWRNCLALTVSQPFSNGGNPTLVEERGKSVTLGAVLEPSFVPGLSFTVDYYSIKVSNLIATLGAQTIINLCYDSSNGLSNPACATVNRNPATGLFVDPAVIAGGINFAAQRTKGIDFDLAFRKTFDNGDKLRVRALATRVLSLNNYINPQQPLEPNRQLSELGDPKWAANFNISYDFGDFSLLYNARFIGKQTIGLYETQNAYKGICPATGVTPNTGGTGNINGAPVPCTAGSLITIAPNNADAFPRIFYPAVLYHDVRVDFEVGNDFNFYAGVNNLLDRLPPLGDLGTAGGSPFDSFGRNFFFGFEAKF